VSSLKKPCKYIVQAYWDARPRDLERDATQLHLVLRRLGEIDGRLGHWFGADAGQPGEAPSPIASAAAIVSRLEADRREWDHGSRHYTGYQATFNNGAHKESACTLRVALGIEVPSTTVWFPNSFSLQMWGPGRVGTFHDATAVKRALVAASETFRALWGMAGPQNFPESELDDELAGRPLVSWLLYLSAAYGTPPPLPPPSSVELCAGGGHLLAVVPEWLDPTDDEQVATREQVQAILGGAGMLRPAARDVFE
jgi:hypothetical protein